MSAANPVNAEFFDAIHDLEKEKNIPSAYMLERIEQALQAAMKKDYPDAAEAIVVDINEEKKTIREARVEAGG